MATIYASPASCAPHRSTSSTKSCFSYQSLAKIARRYNKVNGDDPIPINGNRDELWVAIKKRVPECDNERCWIKSKWMTAKERSDVSEDFKPPIPVGKYEWLDSNDIDHVLRQYQKVFTNFLFLGTHPIDVETVVVTFKKKLKQGLRASKVTFVGFVLNLDYHNQSGSHWVAIVIDKHAQTFEYFDSFAKPPPKEVEKIFETAKQVNDKLTLLVNKVQHQRQNTECGNYSINFIVQRIGGSTFESVTKNVIRDGKMNEKRKIFFDPLEKK